MMPLSMARRVLDRLLSEVAGPDGTAHPQRLDLPHGIDRRIQTLRAVAAELPADFAPLVRMIDGEPDFEAAFPEVRLRALAEHCRILRGAIDRHPAARPPG